MLFLNLFFKTQTSVLENWRTSPDTATRNDSYVLHAYTPAIPRLASNKFHPIFFALHNSEQIHFASRLFGDNSEKVTPVPIPNTVVKLLSADNTWRATAREHRTSPELNLSEDREICLRGGNKISYEIFLYSSVGRACGR